MAAGYGPGDLTLSSDVAVSNTVTSSVGVAVDWVSAVVGFNVTETRTLHAGYTYKVPDDKREWTVQGGNERITYSFDVHLCQLNADYGVAGTGQAVRAGKLVYRYFPSGEPPR